MASKQLQELNNNSLYKAFCNGLTMQCAPQGKVSEERRQAFSDVASVILCRDENFLGRCVEVIQRQEVKLDKGCLSLPENVQAWKGIYQERLNAAERLRFQPPV